MVVTSLPGLLNILTSHLRPDMWTDRNLGNSWPLPPSGGPPVSRWRWRLLCTASVSPPAAMFRVKLMMPERPLAHRRCSASQGTVLTCCHCFPYWCLSSAPVCKLWSSPGRWCSQDSAEFCPQRLLGLGFLFCERIGIIPTSGFGGIKWGDARLLGAPDVLFSLMVLHWPVVPLCLVGAPQTLVEAALPAATTFCFCSQTLVRPRARSQTPSGGLGDGGWGLNWRWVTHLCPSVLSPEPWWGVGPPHPCWIAQQGWARLGAPTMSPCLLRVRLRKGCSRTQHVGTREGPLSSTRQRGCPRGGWCPHLEPPGQETPALLLCASTPSPVLWEVG